LPFDLAAVRRAALFVVDIGVPVCVGALMGQARAALLAGLCGLLFSFADSRCAACWSAVSSR